VFLIAQVPAVWAVGGFFGLQFAYAVASISDGGRGDNTANWAHVGGFLFGMALARPMRMVEQGKREYRLEDAETAASAGHLDRAAAYYRLSLSEHPADAQTHRQLAAVCAQQGQSEAAHRHYLDALRLLLRGNDLPGAAAVYDEARRQFERFPVPPDLLIRIASACETAGNFPSALHALSELCRTHGDAREAEMALLRMGNLHLQHLQQPRSAQAIFAEFLQLYPQSEWRTHAERFLAEARQATGYEPPPAPTPQQG
jgi:tetratricopeptide (TPR) repeat protein